MPSVSYSPVSSYPTSVTAAFWFSGHHWRANHVVKCHSSKFSFSVVFFGISVLLIGLGGSGKVDFFSVGWDTTPENPSRTASVISSGNLPTDFLGPHNILPWIFLIQNFKTSHLHFWQIICDNLMVSSTSDHDRTVDNVMSKTFILGQPLIFKSILQILQELLETMFVSFCVVFIPWLLPGILDVVVWCRLLHFNCLLLVYSIVYTVVNYCYRSHLVVTLVSHFCQNTLSCYLVLTQ